MGDIADMMLDGTLCEGCGVYMGDAQGFTRRCPGCEEPSAPTLHDLFAIAAMQGMLSARLPAHTGEDGPEALASDAFLIADAMMKAREA